MKDTPDKPPIVNCHTHIFTCDHVPPYLAKTFVPWPLYLLASLPIILSVYTGIKNVNNFLRYSPQAIRWKTWRYKLARFVQRNQLLSLLIGLVSLWMLLQAIHFIFGWLYDGFLNTYNWQILDNIIDVRDWMLDRYILLDLPLIFEIVWVFLVLLINKSGRNFIFFLLRKLGEMIGLLPGKMTRDLFARYLLLANFSTHKQQGSVFSQLKQQHPPGTGFVVLPMDMEYMEGGKLKPEGVYLKQMEAIKELKNSSSNKGVLYPFVFVDPRRMDEDAQFFAYSVPEPGTVKLEESFIQEYLEEHQFSGIKIYPALGYYPFEEALLPLWKYAADHQIPIMTHCIKGTIFYRGKKKSEWDHHPIFEQSTGGFREYAPMLLPQLSNLEFSVNFGHPMNYLCLLEEPLLRKLVAKAENPTIRELFGYTDDDTPLEHDLCELKICFAHFGGEDQWLNFLESDRYALNNHLLKFPDRGVDFLYGSDGEPSRGKPELVWKSVDWYSIICSLMLQYPNVYADISYILHDPAIFPLLKQTLQHPGLKEKVLYGTDFYVVRNHKSEKHMLAQTQALLDEEAFDLIARYNPQQYLNRTFPS